MVFPSSLSITWVLPFITITNKPFGILKSTLTATGTYPLESSSYGFVFLLFLTQSDTSRFVGSVEKAFGKN